MKGFWKDNSYFKISLYAIFVSVVTILFYRFSSNTDNIAPSIMAFLSNIVKIILPILYGLLIAYLFNPIMIFFEKYYKLWFKPQNPKFKKFIRTLSILSVYVCIVGTLIIMVRYLVPQISENIKELLMVLPDSVNELSTKITEMETAINSNIATLPYQLDTSKIFDMINPEKIFDPELINNVATKLMNSALSITSSLYNWIMGLVIAFYMLTQKEDFTRGTKRLIYS